MSELVRSLENNPIRKTKLELKARRKFNKLVRKLSPEAHDFVSLLSSNFMEGDIYAQYKSNPTRLTDLREELGKYGVSEKDADVIFRNFNLPVLEK